MNISEFFTNFVGSSNSFIAEIFGAVVMLIVVDVGFRFILGSISSLFTFKGR